MKVALVHDWLTGMRGGERCLEEFLNIYPDADIFTLIHIPGSTSALIDQRVKQVSFLNKIPKIKKIYRLLLPLYPFAVQELKLEGYDLIVSLSHAVAKNVRTPKRSLHICYCFTPMRYVWDQMFTYFGKLTYLIAPILYLIRFWDRRASQGVNYFVAISKFVAARIISFYHRPAKVVYPPIKDYWLEQKLSEKIDTEAAFLYAGALVPYKNVTEIVRAFNKNKLPLKIAGTGPDLEKLKSLAGDNVTFLGRVSDQELASLYASSRALVFAAKEDFGLIPIESLACGLPVIGPYAGALKESLNNIKYWDGVSEVPEMEPTGVFFRYDLETLDQEINAGVEYFQQKINIFTPEACRERARLFDLKTFRQHWSEILQQVGIGVERKESGIKC